MWSDLWTRLCQMFSTTPKPLTPARPRLPKPSSGDPQEWAEWIAQTLAAQEETCISIDPASDLYAHLVQPTSTGAPPLSLMALKGEHFTTVKFGEHWAFASSAPSMTDGEIVVHPQKDADSAAAKLWEWHQNMPFEEGYSKILSSQTTRHDRLAWAQNDLSVYVIEESGWAAQNLDHNDLRVFRQGRCLVVYDLTHQAILMALQL